MTRSIAPSPAALVRDGASYPKTRRSKWPFKLFFIRRRIVGDVEAVGREVALLGAGSKIGAGVVLEEVALLGGGHLWFAMHARSIDRPMRKPMRWPRTSALTALRGLSRVDLRRNLASFSVARNGVSVIVRHQPWCLAACST